MQIINCCAQTAAPCATAEAVTGNVSADFLPVLLNLLQTDGTMPELAGEGMIPKVFAAEGKAEKNTETIVAEDCSAEDTSIAGFPAAGSLMSAQIPETRPYGISVALSVSSKFQDPGMPSGNAYGYLKPFPLQATPAQIPAIENKQNAGSEKLVNNAVQNTKTVVDERIAGMMPQNPEISRNDRSTDKPALNVDATVKPGFASVLKEQEVKPEKLVISEVRPENMKKPEMEILKAPVAVQEKIETSRAETAPVTNFDPDVHAFKAESSEQPEKAVDTAKKLNIAGQITDKFVMSWTKDTRTLSVRLKPESLGELVIKIEPGADGIRAKIISGSEQVREYISGQVTELTAALSSKGIKAEDIQVIWDKNAAGIAYGMEQGQHGNGTGRHFGNFRPDTGREPAEMESRSRSMPAQRTGSINVFV